MAFYIDENHNYYKNLAEKLTLIICNKEFFNLQSELEPIYSKQGFEKPRLNAFQDALYSFLVQEENLLKAKAY
ncbi:MAG: hypothetical protein GXW85_03970 [Clostridia bacterium]|nr:hypothetical protein [Clostridia bacterium]